MQGSNVKIEFECFVKFLNVLF